MKKARIKRILRICLAVLFVVAGCLHFLKTSVYVQAVPDSITNKAQLVYFTGICELLGGAGLLIPFMYQAAGMGLVVLLVAVFPANIYMALNAHQFPQIPELFLWWRLPLQVVLIALVGYGAADD